MQTKRKPDGLYMDNYNMITLVPTAIPLYICMCINEDGSNVYTKKEKECEECLCWTKRAGMDTKGKVMSL